MLKLVVALAYLIVDPVPKLIGKKIDSNNNNNST
jgi:hypothetical protein